MMPEELGPEIVSGIRGGDSAAAERLNAWFRPRLLMFVIARTGDRALADDVAQDVLLAVIRAIQADQLRDPASLPGFVFGVARNHLGTARRHLARVKEDPLEAAAALTNDPIDIVDRDERERLRRAVDELDATDRRIMQLTLIEGLGPNAVAERLGLASDVVRQRKSRAIRKLTTRLNPSSQSAGVVRPSQRALARGAE